MTPTNPNPRERAMTSNIQKGHTTGRVVLITGSSGAACS